jgi:hypothetical protein
MERENLAGDVKGKGTSGSNREAESTDAPAVAAAAATKKPDGTFTYRRPHRLWPRRRRALSGRP